VGETTTIIVDPQTLQVSHYVVKQSEKPHDEYLVPAEKVVETSSDVVRLSCTGAELLEMETYVVKEYKKVAIPRYTGVETGSSFNATVPEIVSLPVEEERIPEGHRAIKVGTEVNASDGKVGEVEELLLDESGQISHLVLREGHLWGKKRIVLPLSVVDSVISNTVYLKLDKETVSSLLAIPDRSGGVTNVELVVLILGDAAQASNALKLLKELNKKESVIHNIAVLTKDAEGKTSLKETEDVSPKHGALFGAVTGGLVGLLAGPVGAVVGAAAGAATGGIAAGRIDMGFPDEYLKTLQENLEPGRAAVVALVDQAGVDSVQQALTDVDGELLRLALTDNMVNRLTEESE
jgi:uncharacterized membrane protein